MTNAARIVISSSTLFANIGYVTSIVAVIATRVGTSFEIRSFGESMPELITSGNALLEGWNESMLSGMILPRWEACRDTQVPDDVERLLATVPEWFGRPDSNAEYIDAARSMETWTVRDGNDRVIGVTLVSHHFPKSSEIHFTVVDRSVHGRGVGSAMIRAIADDLRRRGIDLLMVKTLGPSKPDPNYARTRHFYETMGFVPLEETDLWGADTPCLIMVKPLT